MGAIFSFIFGLGSSRLVRVTFVCGPVVSTRESNSRRFRSFTSRAEHQSINYPENVNFF